MYSYSEMIRTIEEKYGVDSHEVITLKLMWIAYRGGGKRITSNRIIEYYKKLLTKSTPCDIIKKDERED